MIKTYDGIESVFVHIEPSKQTDRSIIIPVEDINGLDSKVYGHFGRAPYFIILKLDNNGLEIEDFYYNEFIKEKDRIHVGVKVINAVIKHRLDIVFTPKIGEIAFYMLKDHFVDIYRAEEGSTVREIIEKFRNNQSEPITAPHPAEESEIGRQNADHSMRPGTTEIKRRLNPSLQSGGRNNIMKTKDYQIITLFLKASQFVDLLKFMKPSPTNLPIGFSLVDQDGLILDFNPAAEKNHRIFKKRYSRQAPSRNNPWFIRPQILSFIYPRL